MRRLDLNNNTKRFEEMTYFFNHIYTDVNVIDMTADIYIADNEDKYNNNLNKLKDLTFDINKVVIMFNISHVGLSLFYGSRMAESSIPKKGYDNATDEDELIVFRNAKSLVCPKEQENDEELIRIIKNVI
jgi:hypothetical protein